MPVTSLKLPYPAPDDPIADYPAQASSMAWTLDTLLSRLAPLTAPVIVGSKPSGVIVPQFLAWKQNVDINAGLARLTPPMTHQISGLIFAIAVPTGSDAQSRRLSFATIGDSWSWNSSEKSFVIATDASVTIQNFGVAVFAIFAKES